MDIFKNSINKGISKGGLLGALVGAVASTQIHKKEDNLPKKALKTGTLTTIGYLLGAWVEKLFSRNRNQSKI